MKTSYNRGIKYLAIPGETYGFFTIIKEVQSKRVYGRRFRMVKCKCLCGNIKTVELNKITSGQIKSCGCVMNSEMRSKEMKARFTTHGLYQHPLYKRWMGIKSRCFCKNETGYKNYGGRGITICDEWKNNFKSFYDWCMANGYQKRLDIDRINNNGNYEPNNCRFVSRSKNMFNTRRNVKVIVNGESILLAEICEQMGLSLRAMYNRTQIMGLPFNEAVSYKSKLGHKLQKYSAADLLEIKNQILNNNTASAIAELLNIPARTIYYFKKNPEKLNRFIL